MIIRRKKDTGTIEQAQASDEVMGAYALSADDTSAGGFPFEQHETAEVPRQSGPRPPLMTIRITRRAVRNLVLVLIVIGVLLGAARSLHWWGWGLSSQELQQQQVATLVAKVGDLMLLPQEAPVVATVTDAAALKKSQAFYADAENGDVLMLYATSSRAILYRPSTNKIINVGPVYNTASQPARTSAAATSSVASTATSSASK